nr:uncharacterized protein CTRU02_13285 [Colletotrichum truncatum]KAF6783522.1 hypothetical protein CTRU02_13285 [Colletotrichum truncatum]
MRFSKSLIIMVAATMGANGAPFGEQSALSQSNALEARQAPPAAAPSAAPPANPPKGDDKGDRKGDRDGDRDGGRGDDRGGRDGNRDGRDGECFPGAIPPGGPRGPDGDRDNAQKTN